MMREEKIENHLLMAIMLWMVSILVFMPDLAHAADPLACTLDRIQSSLTGSIGKGIATIAIVALGIGLFLGKLSWGLAIATSMGVGMIFGAANIVNWLSGGVAGSLTGC